MCGRWDDEERNYSSMDSGVLEECLESGQGSEGSVQAPASHGEAPVSRESVFSSNPRSAPIANYRLGLQPHSRGMQKAKKGCVS
jgi:hypothetical protein